MMEEKKERKTDRRTLYTQMVIKDAFLKLKETTSYNDITIAALCREAEISRGTFYLHYDNVRQVLDAVLDDVLSSVHGLLEQLDSTDPAGGDCSWPLCRFLRENKKYQSVFFDDGLYSLVVDRLAAASKEGFVIRMLERTRLSREAIEALFYFQISGCLAVSKRNASEGDARWEDIQCAIDGMLKAGIEKF